MTHFPARSSPALPAFPRLVRAVNHTERGLSMSALQMTLKVQKKALRKAITTKLAALSPQVVQEQTLAASNLLFLLPTFQLARTLSCYLSMPSGEINTMSLASEILQSGRTLFVPKILDKSGDMDFLEVYDEHDLATLPSGVWGIKEPDINRQGQPRRKALETPELDLILLPAVAFDRTFGRLGHGKGFYDRFVTTYQTSFQRRPILGLALREQILQEGDIPMGDHDWPMDYIVTPDQVLVNPKAPRTNTSQ